MTFIEILKLLAYWAGWLLLGALDVFFSTLAILLALAMFFGVTTAIVGLFESVRAKLNAWHKKRMQSMAAKAYDSMINKEAQANK